MLFPVFLAILIFLFGSKVIYAAENTEKEADRVQEALFEEFDFSKLDQEMKTLFPDEKLSFREILMQLISENGGSTAGTVVQFIKETVFYQFGTNKKILVYMILIAVAAALFNNFTSVFQNRQVSEVSFYILYMLLMTLSLVTFQHTLQDTEQLLSYLTEFMKLLCPSYFLAVAFAAGSSSALVFYNIVLWIIYLVELVILELLMPIVHVFVMIQVLSNLTGEDLLSEFADLIRKGITWCLKTLLAGVVGINVLQGLLAPAIDTVKRSAVNRTVEAIPWIGDVTGGVAEVALGSAVLIKNGIGAAGMVIAVMVCAVPVIRLVLLAFIYKFVAAMVQPVSDKRITACIGGVSEGYGLLLQILLYTALFFLFTLAVIAGATS